MKKMFLFVMLASGAALADQGNTVSIPKDQWEKGNEVYLACVDTAKEQNTLSADMEVFCRLVQQHALKSKSGEGKVDAGG